MAGKPDRSAQASQPVIPSLTVNDWQPLCHVNCKMCNTSARYCGGIPTVIAQVLISITAKIASNADARACGLRGRTSASKSSSTEMLWGVGSLLCCLVIHSDILWTPLGYKLCVCSRSACVEVRWWQTKHAWAIAVMGNPERLPWASWADTSASTLALAAKKQVPMIKPNALDEYVGSRSMMICQQKPGECLHWSMRFSGSISKYRAWEKRYQR